LSFEPCKSKRPKASRTIKSSRKIFTGHFGSRISIPVANASSGDMYMYQVSAGQSASVHVLSVSLKAHHVFCV